MSEPIKVGDLVQVVKSRRCCGNTNGLGRVFVVIELLENATCETCGPIKGTFASIDGWFRCEVVRLKRIPPLVELEGQRTQEDIREPA